MRDPRRLNRLLRVRTVQRDMAQAEEVSARGQAAQAGYLVDRIDRLHADVAPQHGGSSGMSLQAAAAFRLRLQPALQDAQRRLSTAEALVARRADATRDARQDHGAMEKLAERAAKAAAEREMRALIDAPSTSTGTGLAGRRRDLRDDE